MILFQAGLGRFQRLDIKMQLLQRVSGALKTTRLILSVDNLT